MTEGGGGFRAPWWLTLGAALLLGIMLVMHGRVEFVDKPLFHIWVLPVTLFGIISLVATTIVLLTVRNALDSFRDTLRVSKWLLIFELLIVVGGVSVIIQAIAYGFGHDLDLAGGFARLLGGLVRPREAQATLIVHSGVIAHV